MNREESQKRKILVVEDDQFLSSIIEEHFKKVGYSVEIAKGGAEALKFIEKSIPDIMLLDILMPEVSGFDVLKKVRADARYKDMPIIVFSNLGQESEIEEGKRLGADDFLVKARFMISEVIQKVDALIDKKRGQ